MPADGGPVDPATTNAGLRRRTRSEPTVAFNRFAQPGELPVRKSRSPEDMRSRLLSFAAGKSAARDDDVPRALPAASESSEPSLMLRRDDPATADTPSSDHPSQNQTPENPGN